MHIATTFLELWKRKQSVIIWEWDLQNIDSDEENRPEFEASVKTFRTNPVTREKEPYMPTSSRAVRYVASGSAVLFMVCFCGYTFFFFIRIYLFFVFFFRFALYWELYWVRSFTEFQFYLRFMAVVIISLNVTRKFSPQ